MKRITTAFLLLAGILLTLPGMGQTAQQPSGAPGQSQTNEAQVSQADIVKAITQALGSQNENGNDPMQEQISITVGEKRALSMPFAIESCK